MIQANLKNIKRYENDLKNFKNKAFPFATKATVNGLAFQTMKNSKELIKNKMVLKNQFTSRSIRVEKAHTLKISKQEAIVGSVLDYMEDQEFGTTKRKDGKHGVAIATGYSAGQENQKRTRLPRKPNKLKNIQLQRRAAKAKTRKQRNFIAIQDAANSNRKYVFLDLGKTKGIFKVIGGKRNPRIKMVYSLKKQSVRIPANPWLLPSTMKANSQRDKIYLEAIIFQLKRHNLFKG